VLVARRSVWDEMALSGVMLLGMMVLLALPVVLKQSTARVPFGLLLRVAAVQMMATVQWCVMVPFGLLLLLRVAAVQMMATVQWFARVPFGLLLLLRVAAVQMMATV